MIRITIKKENLTNWTSLKETRVFKHKFIAYYIYKMFYKILGYEVEVLDE